ncbi:hypothetical protein F5877DRAFT_67094 [Lentinula edodes]|nr:hypothetical protein F5877DRAFT_67094 [Lentinula edodes]
MEKGWVGEGSLVFAASATPVETGSQVLRVAKTTAEKIELGADEIMEDDFILDESHIARLDAWKFHIQSSARRTRYSIDDTGHNIQNKTPSTFLIRQVPTLFCVNSMQGYRNSSDLVDDLGLNEGKASHITQVWDHGCAIFVPVLNKPFADSKSSVWEEEFYKLSRENVQRWIKAHIIAANRYHSPQHKLMGKTTTTIKDSYSRRQDQAVEYDAKLVKLFVVQLCLIYNENYGQDHDICEFPESRIVVGPGQMKSIS